MIRTDKIKKTKTLSSDFFVRHGKALEVVVKTYVESALTQHDGKSAGSAQQGRVM